MPTEFVDIFNAGDYDAQIRHAAELLDDGGLVVLPTETVYGIAARLDKPQALDRLKALRGGEAGAFTIHLPDRTEAHRFIGPTNDFAGRIMRKLWPGPVSLVFEVAEERRQTLMHDLAIAPSDIFDGTTITLRCPDQIVTSDVLQSVHGPVVAMAAAQTGTSGKPLLNELNGKVDLILDAGPGKYPKPSTMLRMYADHYEILREGALDQRILERLLRTMILFVCSGNTCRSPMAEALARTILAGRLGVAEADLDKKGINVLSAGSFAMPGSRATPQAVTAVERMGSDLSRHRSRPLTQELINQADLIFTMGHSHKQAVIALSPYAIDKVQTLDPKGDIDDPIGGDLEVYRSLARELHSLIEKRLQEFAGRLQI